MKALTYGVLPSKAEFEKAYREGLGSGFYEMKLMGQDRKAVLGLLFQVASRCTARFTMEEMWIGLRQLVRRWGNDHDAKARFAGDLASGILQTLGFEWI